MLDRLRQNVRYASRALFRSPIFTLVSIVSIAIGIGATTAINGTSTPIRRLSAGRS